MQAMKKYKYITIRHTSTDAKTNRPEYTVTNTKHGDVLGDILYNAQWRRYTFAPDFATEFSSDCHRDIADFMDNHAGREEADHAKP